MRLFLSAILLDFYLSDPLAQRVLDDLGGSRLVKTKNYVFQPGDLADFNKKYSGDDAADGSIDIPSNNTSAAVSVSTSEAGTPYPGFDEEHIRYSKYYTVGLFTLATKGSPSTIC